MKKLEDLLGQSDAFLDLVEQVSKLAPIERPVLIIGERGTGKELIAKRLHFLSKRWDKTLLTLNCAALNDNLIDSELFGHEMGAFSGAKNQHKGRFERAEGGSLFLDELATAPIAVQEKLLRVIEYGEYERVGGSQVLQADVRLIAATNQDLPRRANEGRFRVDLLDRLAFDVIQLPPLRKRAEDILLLAEHFAINMCQELNYSVFSGFSQSAQKTLLSYHWPGNIRELKNVVERAIYRHGLQKTKVNEIVLDPFAARFQPATPLKEKCKYTPALPINLRQWQQQKEQELVENALNQAKFNQQVAAKLLGLNYDQFRGLIKKYQR